MLRALRVFSLFLLLAAFGSAIAQNLPPGFVRTDVLHLHSTPGNGNGLPTVFRFAHDGRVFVAQKDGQIYVYPNMLATTATLVVDLSTEVHASGEDDRGLLGFALHPRFPEVPYLYVLYAVDGGAFTGPTPFWHDSESCTGGCVISGRLSRLTLSATPAATAASEMILIEDWYQQFTSHSIGTLNFGADGYLYASGGDGASFNQADWGQIGNAAHPDFRSPTNEGGALRSQGMEDEPGYANNMANPDPSQRHVWLNGSVIRVDATSGAPAPGNPLAGVAGESLNAQRIIAYGLRNPFRFTVRPGTNEVWIGNVGWNTWEQIDVVPDVTAATPSLKNFGWPCFEGPGHNPNGYTNDNLPICQALYSNSDTGGRTPWTPPFQYYSHNIGSSAISGLAFYTAASYAGYQNALFFSDYNENRIYVAKDTDADGLPNPIPLTNNNIPNSNLFYGNNVNAVYLATGPGGDLFFSNINDGTIVRITSGTNAAPTAAIALAAGSNGNGIARTIDFTAANSVDPNAGDTLSYDWDLDGDGNFGDASTQTASHNYVTEGNYTVSVRVTDNHGASDVQRMIVTVGPTADASLSIVDGKQSVRPSQALTYAVTVTNHDTSALAGLGVAVTFPATLTGVTWTCATSAGSVCTASGSGNIAETVNLLAGATATFTVHATVAASASDGTTIDVAGSLTLPAGYGDPNLLDNADDDVDTVYGDVIFDDGFETPPG